MGIIIGISIFRPLKGGGFINHGSTCYSKCKVCSLQPKPVCMISQVVTGNLPAFGKAVLKRSPSGMLSGEYRLGPSAMQLVKLGLQKLAACSF